MMLALLLAAATALIGPSPAGTRVPLASRVPRSVVSPRMNAHASPTETIDMVGGTVRAQTPVTEGMMRPRPNITWANLAKQLEVNFEVRPSDEVSKPDLVDAYRMMVLCRQFENGCNQAYMQGLIRGFMHLDNGQETIPAMMADTLKKGDIKVSYYREHTHALASGVPAEKIMAELMMKVDGTCKGTGGSMHIYDVETNFQGGWALVAEQLPYAVGGARSILLDRQLGKVGKDDDRIAIVFVGEGGAQNGRMAECLNAAAKENLPILFVVIDNGRAINTFTPDVAQNSEVFTQGAHYGVPGIKVDGGNLLDTMRTGRAVVDYVRKSGPALLQIHTYRLTGHSPADPEHERGRKAEKKWARAEADPIKLFEASGLLTQQEMDAVQEQVKKQMNEVMAFAKASPEPPAELAKQLEFPDKADTDYNGRPVAYPDADAVTARLLSPAQREGVDKRLATLRGKAADGSMSIGDAVNLAILEEMLRDPTTVIHAEDLQAGSSYDIPAFTQQTFGKLRAADEIIDEGHFMGKALGEGLNGYRPIVELMNSNFGIYGMAELSSAGNTYATTGGQFQMPMTVIGAGGTAPNQALGAEHSQPFHAYVMGIPGLKICTASSPEAAYGITKSMIRDNGPCILFCPVKMMKEAKGQVPVGTCLPLNKAALLHEASDKAVAAGKAVTVLTYLHGVKEAQMVIEAIQAEGCDIDLLELRSLKPLDMDSIRTSLQRTHKLAILDESTYSGGVGATVSAAVSETLFFELDAPVRRLCMDDAPVPYASSMEKAVVKRGSDLVDGVLSLVFNKA
ncbi:hypothetical protein KFE25_006021 [Diacronema lutheri]|uniref:Transketolase-like pyrimidine-binding domain-containing protein n=2 Tax=Diacronema lutheri TaxID=2081491 RepID=A0A8J6CFX7_DIALT|nr:hypothetical protein KFE25_006021 [Diacronema lutheri]